MAKKINIPDEVLDVLRQSTITENSLMLPAGELERKLYMAVDKIIKAAGGKWDRRSGTHVFKSDPRELLGLAMDEGKIDNKKQIFQEFFTPHDVAVMMCRDVLSVERVLEPSAGTGNIAKAVRDIAAIPVCYDIQQEYVDKLVALDINATQADFLTVKPPKKRFDHVLMNPPFTAGQFQLHVQHAFKFLKPGGTLKAIGPANLGGENSAAQRAFMEWLSSRDTTVEPLPEGTFKKAGTSIDTVLLTIRT